MKKKVPYAFVLDALARGEPYTKPMFGCTGVYVGDRIVVILREKEVSKADNGVWLATTHEHHDSLRAVFPSLRSIRVFGDSTGWQNLPAEADDFEEAALRACQLILRGDPRIGKVPKPRKNPAAKRVVDSKRRKG
jgi:hypothetical protein